VRDAGRRERSRRQGPVAGLAVARDRLHQAAEHGARQPVGEIAVPAHAVAPAEEARAEHVVGAAARHRLEHACEVRRVVLAVTVDVDGRGVSLVARALEPGAKSGAQAAAHRMRDHRGAELPGDVRSGVARAVVDQNHVDGEPARLLRQSAKHIADRRLLVARHDDREAAPERRARPLHVRIRRRHQRAAAGGRRGRDSEQRRDRPGQLED